MDTFNSLRHALSTSFGELVQALTAYLPDLVIALLLLLLGWLLARLLRGLILRFGSGIDRLMLMYRPHAPTKALPLRKPASDIVARLAYWLVILFFVAAAVEPLGLPGLAEWLNHFIRYLPRILVGTLVVLVGYLLGGIVHDIVRSRAQARSSEAAAMLGLVCEGLIVACAVILGIDQLGLDITLLVNIVTIAAAALLGGLGLAFGLGASHQVSNVLASHHLRKLYRVGQRVRVGGIEGCILELTATAVILDTEEGQAVVPARHFTDQISLLRRLEDGDE